LPCLVGAPLDNPQAGKAECDPQLPEQGVLLACGVERLAETFLRRQRGLALKQDVAFDAQRLGEIQVVTVLASDCRRQSLIHGVKRLIDLAKAGKSARERGIELRIRHAPAGFTAGTQGIAQRCHTLRKITPLDHQLA